MHDQYETGTLRWFDHLEKNESGQIEKKIKGVKMKKENKKSWFDEVGVDEIFKKGKV